MSIVQAPPAFKLLKCQVLREHVNHDRHLSVVAGVGSHFLSSPVTGKRGREQRVHAFTQAQPTLTPCKEVHGHSDLGL